MCQLKIKFQNSQTTVTFGISQLEPLGLVPCDEPPQEASLPRSSGPDPGEDLHHEVPQDDLVDLVQQEHRLAQDAVRLVPATSQQDDKERFVVLVSALTFSINVTEHKVDSLARQAARLINDENVLGATLAVRSMLEHHAVAIELGEKLRALWEEAEKGTAEEIMCWIYECYGCYPLLQKQLLELVEKKVVTRSWRAA